MAVIHTTNQNADVVFVQVSCLAAGADGKRLLSGASNGELFVWNVMSGTVLQKLTKEDPREVPAHVKRTLSICRIRCIQVVVVQTEAFYIVRLIPSILNGVAVFELAS